MIGSGSSICRRSARSRSPAGGCGRPRAGLRQLVDRPVGSIVYTQFLNERGIVGDVTVTRLSDDRFRVTTGSAAVDADPVGSACMNGSRMAPSSPGRERGPVGKVRLWGPLARDVLASVTESDVSNEALPYLSARELRVGPAPVFAQRISWVGELGWELWVEPRWAVAAWIGRRTPAGLRSRALRLPGARGPPIRARVPRVGSDLTAGDTPDEAGLSFCVDVSKDFVGRPAILATREAGPEKPRTPWSATRRELPIYGGEAVHSTAGQGRAELRVRFHRGTKIAFAYPPTSATGDRGRGLGRWRRRW